MNPRLQRTLFSIALPLVVGGVLAALFVGRFLPNPILYIRSDISALSMVVGAVASVGIGVWLAVREWRHRQDAQRIADVVQGAAEERRKFLRRLDHELKNPLMAMRVGLANVAEGQSHHERTEALSSVQAQAVRLSTLVADLRKIAELESRPLEQEAVDMVELLEEAVEVIRERPDAAQRRIGLTVPQLPWPLSTIQGDRDLLFLGLHNLLDNALKYTRVGDAIEVRAYENENRVVLEVADTGVGIPDSDLASVWDELYRSEAVRGIPGSGLGLPLVRAIVERHGGTVALRSREGQGTIVTLQLPVHSAS